MKKYHRPTGLVWVKRAVQRRQADFIMKEYPVKGGRLIYDDGNDYDCDCADPFCPACSLCC